jgi:5-hydroxyisourate hydrolase-like protein (transthyretin family)
MNKKVISTLTAGTFALLFTACGDTVVDADNPPISPTAKLNVVVLADNTGEPLGGATVKLVSTGEIGVTNASNGGISFSSVYAGTIHTVQVEKEGYASLSGTGTIEHEATDNVYMARENTISIRLFPKTASLDGYLYWPDTLDAKKSNPAVGAKVLIQYSSDDILNKYDTIIVAADGKFTSATLAAVGESYSISALPFNVGSYTFNSATGFSTPSLSSTTPAHITAKPIYDYDSETSVFTLLSYTSKVTTTSPVVFTFSDDVSEATKKISSGETCQPVDFSWNGNTLTVTPLGGKWLSADCGINISKEPESKKGHSFKLPSVPYKITVEDFEVDLTGKDVTGFDASGKVEVGSTITLTWTKMNDMDCEIANYEVYHKVNNKYEKFPTINKSTDLTKCVVNYIPTLNDVGTVTFAVRAVNSTSKTKLALKTTTVVAATP